MTRIQCNRCGHYKDEIFIYTSESGENYCNNCKSAIQKQEQEQLSAYSWKVAHDIFVMTTEFLEKYIEKADYYSDWEQRKQIRDNRVQRDDKNPEEAEKSFSTMLFLFAKNLKGKSSEFGEELKGEFYQLIDGAGIDVDNCLPRLGCVLVGIHEVLEGNSKKIMEDERNAKEDYDINSPEYAKALGEAFLDMQSPLDNEIETSQSLEGKSWKQITLENKFKNGNKELGKEAFRRIKNSISTTDYQKKFYFFPQKEQQITMSQGKVLTEKIKQNLHEWEIKKVVVFKGHFAGKGEIKELALVHKEASLKGYNWQGYLQFDSRMIYFKKDHKPEEWVQVEQYYSNRVGGSDAVQPNNLQQHSNSEIVQDVKNNPRNWRKDEVITEYNNRGEGTKKEMALIYYSAEVGYDGAVYNWQQPIYLPQRFNQAEIAEINQALGISQTSTSIQHGQKTQSFSDEDGNSATPNSNKSDIGLGTVVIITSILALASLSIYGVVSLVKKPKK
jgi:hypothetical protein